MNFFLSFPHCLKLSFSFHKKWKCFLAGKKYFTVKYLQCFSKFFSKGKVAEYFAGKALFTAAKIINTSVCPSLAPKQNLLKKPFYPNCFQTPKPKLKEFCWKEHFNHQKLTTLFLIFFSWNISQNSKTLVTKTIHKKYYFYISFYTYMILFKCVSW